MKRMQIIITTVLLLLISSASFGQSMKITVDQIKTDAEGKYNLEITVEDGDQEFQYFLYKGEPWKKGKLIEKSDLTTERNYVFETIKDGEYFIGVVDKSKKSAFKLVTIDKPDK